MREQSRAMRSCYRLVFISSLSVLSLEILLIRIFSIQLSYHYASLIISISMMGLVLGGICTYLARSCASGLSIFGSPRRCFFPSLLSFVYALSLSHPAVFIISSLIPFDHYRILWENSQILYLFLSIGVFSIPFFFYGIILSLSLSSYPRAANKIYASDLFGAVCGIAVVVFLLDHLKIEHIIVICSIGVAILFLLEIRKVFLKALCGLVLLLLWVPILVGTFTVNISPYKSLMQALKDDGAKQIDTLYSAHSRVDLFENQRMRSAPGLSLTYQKAIPKGLGLAIDGEVAGAILRPEDVGITDFLPFLPSSLPFHLGKADRVMVVGLRNGLDVQVAYAYGAREISVAEKNPSVVRLVRRQFGTESVLGKVLHPASARVLIKDIGERMDVILLPRAGFFPSGTFGLQEDYEVTVEALALYLSRLREDGFLFIQTFILPPPRYELRMMNNIVEALQRLGTADTKQHLCVFRTWDTMNFLVKRSGFTEEERGQISRYLEAMQFDAVYPDPIATQQFIIGLDYRYMFRQLTDEREKGAFIKHHPFDIRPTTDDRPFFHYFLKMGNIRDIYVLSGKKWAYFLYEDMALPFILLFLVLLTLCIFVFALIGSKKRRSLPCPSGNWPLAPDNRQLALCYFAVIGFSFMGIEVFFIHTMVLPFGTPVIAFSVVLAALLFGSSCGSLLSGHLEGERAMRIMAGAPFLLVVYFFLPAGALTSTWSFLFMVPLGILLGFFFPVGLRLLCSNDTRRVPLAYATNGAASIISPLCGSLIAVAYGLKVLLVCSSGLYCLALLLLHLSGHRYKGNTA